MFNLNSSWAYIRFKADETGVTIVEYAIMLVLVAVMVVIFNPEMQSHLSMMFSGISSFLNARSDGLN